jgi:hypothetical protein
VLPTEISPLPASTWRAVIEVHVGGKPPPPGEGDQSSTILRDAADAGAPPLSRAGTPPDRGLDDVRELHVADLSVAVPRGHQDALRVHELRDDRLSRLGVRGRDDLRLETEVEDLRRRARDRSTRRLRLLCYRSYRSGARAEDDDAERSDNRGNAIRGRNIAPARCNERAGSRGSPHGQPIAQQRRCRNRARVRMSA